jgi:hypothetical protein
MPWIILEHQNLSFFTRDIKIILFRRNLYEQRMFGCMCKYCYKKNSKMCFQTIDSYTPESQAAFLHRIFLRNIWYEAYLWGIWSFVSDTNLNHIKPSQRGRAITTTPTLTQVGHNMTRLGPWALDEVATNKAQFSFQITSCLIFLNF